MDGNGLIETLEQLLETEERSEGLNRLPSDTYLKIATYTQKLRKNLIADDGDATSRIARKQLQLIEGMASQLLKRRLEKGDERQSIKDLLPEEKYLRESIAASRLVQERFLGALVNGQPSFFAILQKHQLRKMVTIRFAKPIGEVMGFDMNKYGPFKIHDIARIPSSNADALVASGDAIEVHTSDMS